MKIVRLSQDSNLTRIEQVFKWNRFSGRGPSGITFSRDVHGTVTTGPEEFSFLFTHHTITQGVDLTWTMTNASAASPEIGIRLVATAEIDITATDVTVADNSEISSFLALPAGTYDIFIETFDDSTYTAYIGTVA